MSEPILVIWNPNAGSVDQAKEVRAKLVDHPDMTIYEPTSGADAQAKVQIDSERGTKLIVAAGGDGTINSVINGLAKAPHDVVMGVLPLGTANDWCASLGIPNEIDLAWETLERRVVERLDVVELDTQVQTTRFANIATGGNSHRVTEAITSEMKQRWGALCYVRGAVNILNDLKSFETTISFDGGTPQEFSVWNLLVANGRTSAGRVEVAPRAQLNDGLLDVVIIQAGTMVDLADLSARYLFSDYIQSDQVVYRQAKQITLQSHPPLMFSLDGDLVDEQPISFRCLPAALNVIVGEDFQKNNNSHEKTS
ncbi:MAG: diacylglycerol kinase family lipid kinase [Bythopirellula sp.]|nr:diacylglycerol kinase family lipid kinase [Bythopirellula sp.]